MDKINFIITLDVLKVALPEMEKALTAAKPMKRQSNAPVSFILKFAT